MSSREAGCTGVARKEAKQARTVDWLSDHQHCCDSHKLERVEPTKKEVEMGQATWELQN